MVLTLDCNEICACRSGNQLLPGATYAVDHFRGKWTANFTGQQCDLKELLSTPDNATEDAPTIADGVNVTALMNSYLSPPVILLTMVTNIFVCIVLTRRNMVSPTNVLLLAMAFVDMITGLLPLPWFLLISYTRQSVIQQLCASHYLANLLELMVNTMPTICHTISIWLTVMLAVQRWIYITFPTSVKRICTVQKSIVSIAVLCIVTVAFYTVTQLLWSGSIYFRMRPLATVSQEATGVSAVVSCSVTEHRNYYMGAMIVRTVLVHIIPSCLLTIITGLLIRGLHRASRRRQQLLRSGRQSIAVGVPPSGRAGSCARRTSAGNGNKKRQEKSNSTTLMLVIIVGLFLLVELPMTLIMTVFVLFVSDVAVDKDAWLRVNRSFPFVNFIILVSYPVNFFIYCLMSTQFRQTFTSLFSGSRSRRARALQQHQPASPSAVQRRRSDSPRKQQTSPESVALTARE